MIVVRLKAYISLGILLCTQASPLWAEERVSVFQGDAEGKQLLAFSVPTGTDPDPYRRRAGRPNHVVLVYEDHTEASALEPLAIFSGSGVAIVNDRPERSRSRPTIAGLIQQANVAGPKKIRVVCVDGTHISPSGRSQATQLLASWRACSTRGGTERWYQTTTRDPNAVVATICRDYRLVAGNGDCGEAGRLARVRNRKY